MRSVHEEEEEEEIWMNIVREDSPSRPHGASVSPRCSSPAGSAEESVRGKAPRGEAGGCGPRDELQLPDGSREEGQVESPEERERIRSVQACRCPPLALPLPLRTAALCQRRVAYRQVGKLWRPRVKRLK